MTCTVRDTILPRRESVVSVNGIAIPRDLIAREIQNHPAGSPIMAWTNAARSLVVREVLLQEAKRRNVALAPHEDGDGRREADDEALIRALIEQGVRTPVADEAACRRYYEQNRRRFHSPDIHEAAHILIPAIKADAPGYKKAHEAAAALIAELRLHPECFPELARAHSACSSAAEGGHLGQVASGQTTPEFEHALAALAPGETSAEPVATRYGFHIIRLDRRMEGRALPFELVADRIAEYLNENVRRRAVAQFIARLVSRATIAGVEMPDAEQHRVH